MNIQIENGIAKAPCVFTRASVKNAIENAGYFPLGHLHLREYSPTPEWCCHVDRIVLFDDPDSVSLVLSKVWRDNKSGRAFIEQGRNAETRAREHAMTHKRCNMCSSLYVKNSYCSKCAEDKETSRFYRMSVVDYTGQACVIGDTWLFDPESLRDHLLENDILIEDARIEEAVPHDLPEIELDHWHDDLPEDYDDHTLSPKIMEALSALNSAIREQGKCVSYYRSGNRIKLPDNFMDQ